MQRECSQNSQSFTCLLRGQRELEGRVGVLASQVLEKQELKGIGPVDKTAAQLQGQGHAPANASVPTLRLSFRVMCYVGPNVSCFSLMVDLPYLRVIYSQVLCA